MEPITLSPGGHETREEGMCLLEAVAFLAGEEHSDHPACVSPVLGSLGRALNDGLFRDNLGALVPFAGRFIGTAGQPEVDQRAAYLLADWSVREVAPGALDTIGLADQAAVLRALPSIVDATSAADAARAAADAAYAARAADAAYAAAYAARAAAVQTSALQTLDRVLALYGR